MALIFSKRETENALEYHCVLPMQFYKIVFGLFIPALVVTWFQNTPTHRGLPITSIIGIGYMMLVAITMIIILIRYIHVMVMVSIKKMVNGGTITPSEQELMKWPQKGLVVTWNKPVPFDASLLPLQKFR